MGDIFGRSRLNEGGFSVESSAVNICWQQGFLRPDVVFGTTLIGEEIDFSLQQANSATIR